jgi:hypothetical protein
MIADDGSLQGYNSLQVSVGSGTSPVNAQPAGIALSSMDTFGSFRDLVPSSNDLAGGGATPPEPPVHVTQTEVGFGFSPAPLPPMESSNLLPDLHSLHLAGHDFLIS